MSTRTLDPLQSWADMSIEGPLILACMEGTIFATSMPIYTFINAAHFLKPHWHFVPVYSLFRYLYADLYASAMWTGTEDPESSGNYTSTLIPFSCSKDSPIPCDTAAGSPLPSLGYIYSFGEDNNKDIYVLASKGIYRVVRPSLCDYTCPTEKAVVTPPGTSSKASAMVMTMGKQMRALLLSAILMFWVLVR